MDKRTLGYARGQLQDLRDPALMDRMHDEKEDDEKTGVLKRCPFCGGTAVFEPTRYTSDHHGIRIGFTIKCKDCGARVPNIREIKAALTAEGEIQPTEDGRETAVAEWNRRSGARGY